MAKFLLMSGGGDGLGIALRLKQEGNEVAVWIKEGRAKQNYEGLIRKVKRWDDFLDPSTIVVFDSNGGGRTADRLRARGYPVATGGTFSDQLEIDRAVALAFMQQAGIKIPHSEAFHDWEKARKYVKKEDKRVVFKPSGKTADQVGTYAAYDAEDMYEMLEHFEGQTTGRPDFELQDFVKGCEVSTEGWFNGEAFMRPWNHTIERKAIMNDDLGPSAGCAGNVVWLEKDTNPIVEQGIALMAPILAEHEYMGPIDLNSIVNDEGVWGLEFTPRFGYDAFPAFLELFDTPLGETLQAIATGQRPDKLFLKDKIASGLRLSIPPYPSEAFAPDEGIPIRGFVKADRPHLYFYDVMLSERNKLVNSPAFGAIVTLTGLGDSIVEAMEGPLALADKAKIADKQYRTDLTAEFVKRRAKLDQYLKPKGEPDGIQRSGNGVHDVSSGSIPNPEAEGSELVSST